MAVLPKTLFLPWKPVWSVSFETVLPLAELSDFDRTIFLLKLQKWAHGMRVNEQILVADLGISLF